MKIETIIDQVVADWDGNFTEQLVDRLKTRLSMGYFIDHKAHCYKCKKEYDYTPICCQCGIIPITDAYKDSQNNS